MADDKRHEVYGEDRLDQKLASIEELAPIDREAERRLLWKMDLHLVVSVCNSRVPLCDMS